MKKVFLLIMMLFLAACSGGGGSSSSSGGTAQTNGTGAVSLKFVEGTKQPAAKLLASITPADPGRVRILLSNGTFKKIVDIPFGSTDTTVSLPVGKAYTAEAVYYENGALRRLTDHGTSAAFDVEDNTTNAATIAMTAIAESVAIAPPTSVYSGGTYGVGAPAASVLATAGLQKDWSLAVATTTQQESPFKTAAHLAETPTDNHTSIAAPKTDIAGRLYFQGEFFIKPEFLEAGESATSWIFAVEPTTYTQLLVKSIGGPVQVPVEHTLPQIVSFAVPASKQGTTTISPISIYASDNAGIAGYMMTTDATPPAANDTNWSATAPSSYTWLGALNPSGEDTTLHLYAWVKDYSGNVSLAVDKVTDKYVVINDSPVATKFVVPSIAQFGPTNIPVTVGGKNYASGSTDAALKYKITEKPIAPSATDTWFPIPADGKVTYTVTSIAQAPGTRYYVPLYLWTKDVNTHVSQSSLNNAVIICDIPQVSTFKVLTTVPNGKVVDILDFQGAAAPGRTIAKYLVTSDSTKPLPGAFTLTAPPATFTYNGLATGVATNKPIYAWVLDSNDLVSLAKTTYVRFAAP